MIEFMDIDIKNYKNKPEVKKALTVIERMNNFRDEYKLKLERLIYIEEQCYNCEHNNYEERCCEKGCKNYLNCKKICNNFEKSIPF